MERSHEPSRRRGARIAARYPVTVTMADGGDRTGTTLDLSTNGLSLCAAQPLAPGSRCTLRLELPCRNGPNRLRIDAKSIYSSYSGPGNFRIGMVFVGLDAETENTIRDFADGSRAPHQEAASPLRPSPPRETGMKPIAVVTTVGSVDEARRIARALVERRLAACAQISAVESFYVWDGAVQNENEFRVLFKTTLDQYDSIERAIRELHSYELPAIHAIAIEPVYAPYAAWIQGNSTGPVASG